MSFDDSTLASICVIEGLKFCILNLSLGEEWTQKVPTSLVPKMGFLYYKVLKNQRKMRYALKVP